MSIVIITKKEDIKRDFVNKLHIATNKGVDLVIFVKPKKHNSFKHLWSLYKQVGIQRFIIELYYALLLRLKPGLRSKLNYFKKHQRQTTSDEWIPKYIEVDSLQSKEIRGLLGEISPSLMVVWDTPIIKRNILKSAKNVINLHMGVCPHYRGAVANQFAVHNKDFSNIGSTIHYVNGAVDGGDIIKIIKADIEKSPKEMFENLNYDSQEMFFSVALDLYQGKEVQSIPQNKAVGENFKLKYWTPSVRHKTAEIIAEWENQPQNNSII